MSYAAGTQCRLKSADITSAYFQGKELDRLMLLQPPPDGLEGVEDGGALVCIMPVYGTRDAGRGIWEKLRQKILEKGFQESRITKALFYLRDEQGNLVGWLGTHVDDLLWAVHSDHEHIVDDLLKEFDIREIHQGKFK